MRRGFRIPNLGGATALIAAPSARRGRGASRGSSTAIGARRRRLPGRTCRSDALAADFLFFDADLGHDAQFPWAPGAAPMPPIALIGSEAPGRIEWALSIRVPTRRS